MDPRLSRGEDGFYIAWDAGNPKEKFTSRSWREAIEALSVSAERREGGSAVPPLMVPAASAQGYFGKRVDVIGEDVDLNRHRHLKAYPAPPWKYLPEWAAERDRRASVLADLLRSSSDALEIKKAEKSLLMAADVVRRGGCSSPPM